MHDWRRTYAVAVVCSRASGDQVGRDDAVVYTLAATGWWAGGCRRRWPVSRVSSWLNGRALGNQCRWYRRAAATESSWSRWWMTQTAYVSVRPRAVFPLTRRPLCWWGRDAGGRSAAATLLYRPLASPGSRDCRPTVAFRRVASRRRFVARQQVMTSRVKTRPTTSHCSRRVRLPVWRRVMNRKSMSVSGMTSWRYLAPLTSHVTAGHVSRPVAIYSDLATMDVDTQRNAGDSRADPRRLYNIHALCCIDHCASSPGENVRMKYLPLVHRS